MQVSRNLINVSRNFSTKIPKIPGIPFLGIFNNVNTDVLHSQLDELASDYEKVVQFDIGPFTYNLITDSKLASQILQKQKYDCYPPFPLHHDIVSQLQQSKEIRINPSDIFSSIIKDRKLEIEEEIAKSLEELESNVDRQLEKYGLLNDINEDMKKLMWHLLGNIFFEEDLGIYDSKTDRYHEIEETIEYLLQYAWYPPLWRFLTIPGSTRLFTLYSNICDWLVQKEKLPFKIRDPDHMLQHFMTFAFAINSLSSVLSQFLINVSKYKWIQEDLRQGNDLLFQQCLYETLRCSPPIFLYCIQNKEAFSVEDFEFEENSKFFIAPWIYNRKESEWPNANSWRPERFAQNPEKINDVFHCFDLEKDGDFLYRQMKTVLSKVLELYEFEHIEQNAKFKTGLALESNPAPALKVNPVGKTFIIERWGGRVYTNQVLSKDRYERTIVREDTFEAKRRKSLKHGWRTADSSTYQDPLAAECMISKMDG